MLVRNYHIVIGLQGPVFEHNFLYSASDLQVKFMSHDNAPKSYPIEEALRAQKALRQQAGLGPELFPIEAFVGMISDEIETLRSKGHSDEDIARTISSNSKIEITIPYTK